MSQAQILFEFDVVEAIAKYLFSKNFRVQQRLMPTQKGIDIIATRNVPNELTVYIEAKGATSSRKSSARFSKPFDSAQVKIPTLKLITLPQTLFWITVFPIIELLVLPCPTLNYTADMKAG